MVEFFHRAGWIVEGDVPESHDERSSAVRRQRFDVVGPSVSSTSRLGILSAGIRAVRDASGNREVVAMVGGKIPSHQSDLGVALEAGATVVDDLLAPDKAWQLLAHRGRSHAPDGREPLPAGRKFHEWR